MTEEIKFVTYSPKETKELKYSYLYGTSVETIAESLGKSVRSVISKLTSLGIYEGHTQVGSTKVAAPSKMVMIKAIADRLGAAESELASLEKADKASLKILFESIVI